MSDQKNLIVRDYYAHYGCRASAFCDDEVCRCRDEAATHIIPVRVRTPESNALLAVASQLEAIAHGLRA